MYFRLAKLKANVFRTIFLLLEAVCDIESETLIFEWRRLKLKKKLVFGSKMLEEVKHIPAKIQDLESKPDFLSETEMERIDIEFKTKNGTSKKILEEIATIQKDPNFVKEIALTDLKEKAKNEQPLQNQMCSNCNRGLNSSNNKSCPSGHVLCLNCHPDHPSCPYCHQQLSPISTLKPQGKFLI